MNLPSIIGIGVLVALFCWAVAAAIRCAYERWVADDDDELEQP